MDAGIRVAQTCPPKSLTAEKQENGVSLSQLGKLCVHASSVRMNSRNLTIFHGGASGFEGSQWFPRRAVNAGVYKIESKPCSMFKAVQ